MGRDKSRLRWQGRTWTAHLRETARSLTVPVKVLVIRRDAVPHCGPLSGLHTALLTGRPGDRHLILACDMPFVSPRLLTRLMASLRRGALAAFIHHQGLIGFPCVLRQECQNLIARQIAVGDRSIQSLARRLEAKRVSPRRSEVASLLNLNTPEDWAAAKARAKPAPENRASRRLAQRKPALAGKSLDSIVAKRRVGGPRK